MSEEKRVWKREPRKPLRDMPQSMVLMGHSGVGKSKIVAEITTKFAREKSQVLSLGKEKGFDNLEVNEEKLDNFKLFEAYLDALIKDQPYDFIIIDNLSVLDEWAEIAGTLYYMSTAQGKSFNFKGVGKGPGFKIKTASQYYLPKDEEFGTVHSLADGAGYKFSRTIINRWLQKIRQCAPYVILLGHIRVNRFTNEAGKLVSSTNLDMVSGNTRTISKYVDTMATMYRKKNTGYLSFKSGTDDYDAKCRYDYLDGQEILISEKTEKGIDTFWEKIYPNYE